MREKITSEEYNYDAKIIPRNKIKNVLVDEIIKKARRFLCLITPFWTSAAVHRLDLINLFKKVNKSGVNVYLFCKEKIEEYFQNIELFKRFFFDSNVINCWLVKNLHSKLYYNEKYILLTSANITLTSLGLSERYDDNFEEGILLKLKNIETEKGNSIQFSNLNPFEIPPFFYIQEEKNYTDRFLLGHGYEPVNNIEIPTIFSFPEMMEDWLLSIYTIETYDRNLEDRKLLHIGEKFNFCPICKRADCEFSITYICHRYGIEYPTMKECRCNFLDCEYGPTFRTDEFYEQKCPITVFYCPKNDQFYDPASNRIIEKGLLLCAKYDYSNIYEVFNQNHNNVFYCPNCKNILIEGENQIHIHGNSHETDYIDANIEYYECPKCEVVRLKYCPVCQKTFPNIDLGSSTFHCQTFNIELFIGTHG